MSRDLTGGLATEIAAPVLRPFFALHIGLPDAVRAWTGVGTLTFGGHDYDGTGAFGTIGTIGESADGSAVGMSATLSGIDSSLADDILEQPYRGAAFEVYVGALAEDYRTIAAAPKLLWRGKVDSVQLQDGEQLTVTVTGESRMRDQGRPRIRRYSNEEQQRRFTGDRMFEYLGDLVDIQLIWGKRG